MMQKIEKYLKDAKKANDILCKKGQSNKYCFITAEKISQVTGYSVQSIYDYLDSTSSVLKVTGNFTKYMIL